MYIFKMGKSIKERKKRFVFEALFGILQISFSMEIYAFSYTLSLSNICIICHQRTTDFV